MGRVEYHRIMELDIWQKQDLQILDALLADGSGTSEEDKSPFLVGATNVSEDVSSTLSWVDRQGQV